MKDPNFERKKAYETHRMSERARAWHCPCHDPQATHREGSPGTPLGSHRSLDKQTEKKQTKKSPQTEQNGKKNKRFSQMKKFTFIRFIEPAEREEIGIGHYGAGRGTGWETGVSGKEGARKPLS